MTSASTPTAPSAARHPVQWVDVAEFHVFGGIPPCSCPDCRVRAAQWEAGRAFSDEVSQQLPPAFWTRQEAHLTSRIAAARRSGRAWAFASATGFALLVLAYLVPAHHPAPLSAASQVAAYEAAVAVLERPALGDLEACGLLFAEGGASDEEESL